mgnify:CR=1 FL=1
MVVNDWERGVDVDQNVVLISIPIVLSPNLAPPGKHVLHAYMPGTKPFGLWEDLIVKVLNTKNSKLKDLRYAYWQLLSLAFLMLSFMTNALIESREIQHNQKE